MSHPAGEKKSSEPRPEAETLSIASRQFDLQVHASTFKEEKEVGEHNLSDIIQFFGEDQVTPPSMDNISIIEEKNDQITPDSKRGDDTILGMLRGTK